MIQMALEEIIRFCVKNDKSQADVIKKLLQLLCFDDDALGMFFRVADRFFLVIQIAERRKGDQLKKKRNQN